VKVNGVRILEFGPDEFAAERFRYASGEHLTIIAPTQNGKTTLGFKLLRQVAHPRRPAVVLIMKPKDKVPAAWGKALGYRTVQTWPPPPSPINANPPGYLVWPRHTFDENADDARLSMVLGKAIRHSYRKGNRIIVADELYGSSKELKLDRPLIAVWSRGSGMGVALWSFIQRPAFVPGWAYSQPRHIFLGPDPDERTRRRFGEIGGVDPKLVGAANMQLGEFEWLYIGRTGPRPVMCIIRKAD